MSFVNTIEEFKKAMRCCTGTCCAGKECPYYTSVECATDKSFDAITIIEHLESRLNQAVEDMRKLGQMGANICPVCAYYNHGEGCKEKCVPCITNKETDNFRWRGEKTDGGAV